MKKQLPAILLGIASIALLIAYNNKNAEVHQLKSELALLKNQSETEHAPLNRAKPSETTAVVEIDTDTAEQVTPTVPTETPGESRAASRRMMANMAKMMDNPTMNKVMEASQRGALGALYIDLIEYLNLNAEETNYFMDLLMHRQMKQMDLGMKMMSGQLSDEEKQALQKDIEQTQKTVKEEMEKFLNNSEDYAEWEFYEKTISERMMLSQMDKDLSGTDNVLSSDTYRNLLGMMHDERANFQFTSDFGDQQNTDMTPQRFSKENVQNFARDIERLNENIGAKAKELLTAEQYTAFISSLKSTTDMQLAQLEMAAQMFGGGE